MKSIRRIENGKKYLIAHFFFFHIEDDLLMKFEEDITKIIYGQSNYSFNVKPCNLYRK